MKRIIVGLSGASGVIYGIRLLEVLQALPDVESHLVMSTAAATTIPSVSYTHLDVYKRQGPARRPARPGPCCRPLGSVVGLRRTWMSF